MTKEKASCYFCPTRKLQVKFLIILILEEDIVKDNLETTDNRIIGVGAQILRDLGIKKIRLLGASVKYPLTGFDLEITEFIN